MSVEAIDAAAFQQHTVRSDTREIRYLEAGSGPPVVMLHGGGGLRQASAHEILAQRYRVVLIEQPGFGASQNEDAMSPAEYAACVHRAAKEVAGSSYHLVGTSFGSRIAAWIAVQFEPEIETLVMLSPAVFTPEGFTVQDGSSSTGPPQLYAHPERFTPPDLEPAVRARQLATVKRFMDSSDPDLEAALALIELPTLVAFGTEDLVMSPSLAHKYPELNQHIFLSFFFDAGHVLEDERPEALASLLDKFFQYRVEYHVARENGQIFP